jgi:hypothetical protein
VKEPRPGELYNCQRCGKLLHIRSIMHTCSPQNPPTKSEYSAPFWDMTFEEAIALAERMNAEEN